MIFQIAIDGPAGAGKSTIAKEVADRLGFDYIDTGSMYRAVTLKALALEIDLEDEAAYKFIDSIDLSFKNGKIHMDGKNVQEKIRSLDVTNNVSQVAKQPMVRKKLVEMQKELAEKKNVIMDGRDIGTVVLPNANLKVYLDASIEERAKRRICERKKADQKGITLEEMMEEIRVRDVKDSTRKVSPLVRAEDAIILDSSGMTKEQVIEEIISLVTKRGFNMEKLEQTLANNEETVVEEKAEETKAAKPKATRKKKTTSEEVVAEEVVAKEEEVVVEEKPKKTRAKKTQEASEEVAAEEKPAPKKRTKKATPEKEEEPVVESAKEEVKVEEPVETVELVPTPQVEESAPVAEQVEVAQEAKPKKKAAKKESAPAKEQEKTLKPLQLVTGTIVKVIDAIAPELDNFGNEVKKGRAERVLVQLEDNHEGYIFRNDMADITPEDNLHEKFPIGEDIEVVVKKVFPDGGKVLLSTNLLDMRQGLASFEEAIKNHEIFTAKAIKDIKIGLLLKHKEFSCLLPTSQIEGTPEEHKDLIGKEIEVAPIRVDYGRIRLVVSQLVAQAIKNRMEKEQFMNTLEIGQIFEGTVKNIEKYGAFVELEKGIEGLLHISELAHERVFNVEKILKQGDTVKVQIINLEKDRIGLSRKALIPNYWQSFMEEHKEGDTVKAKIVEINNAGVVVVFEHEVNGFLPKSEFSWERDTFIEDFVAVGDEIEAKIIELDLTKKRIILSRKQLMQNPWDKVELNQNDKIKVSVTKVLKDGFKVDFAAASGYLPKTNVDEDVMKIEDIKEGDILDVTVRVFDASRTRLIVTMRQRPVYQERSNNRTENPKFAAENQERLTSNFGDLLAQMKNKK